MAVIPFRPRGMNNVKPVDSLGIHPDSKAIEEAALLQNVDPHDMGGVTMRAGQVLRLAGNNPHSGWSDGKYAFFVEGSVLFRFVPPASTKLLAFLSNNDDAVFCRVNDVVVMSNGTDLHVIENGVVTEPFTPTDPFKYRMTAGQCLAFYNGRLYVAKDNVLYCSDSLDVPGGVESMDERYNVVAVFASDITMVRGVNGGLFVSDSEETFFLPGNDQVEGGFGQNLVLPYPALKGTDRTITPELLGGVEVQGECAIWASDRGVCFGLPGGQVINVSAGTFAYQPGEKGTAVVREQNGQVHYLCAMQGIRAEHNKYQGRSMTVSTNPIQE